MKVAQHAIELHGGNGMMLDFGVEKLLRDAAIFLHMDATVDISKMKIVKGLFSANRGQYQIAAWVGYLGRIFRSQSATVMHIDGHRACGDASAYRNANRKPISTTTRPMSCGTLGITPSAR